MNFLYPLLRALATQILPAAAKMAAAKKKNYDDRQAEKINDYESKQKDYIAEQRAGYWQSAVAAYKQGHYDKAIADCTEAIRIGPLFSPPYYCRGKAYEKLGQQDKAAADFAKSRELNPWFDPELD